MTETLFVPGRLCLFGEHADWAAGHRSTHPEIPPGMCLVTGTDAGLHADLEPGGDALVLEAVLSDGTRHGPERIPVEYDALDAVARGDGFFRYAAGVAAEVVARHEVGGLGLSIRADLPVGKGLSSSAAACVLIARAFDRAHGLGLSTRDEMQLAYAGERRAGSECGRMDQICAYGQRPTLVRFDGPDLEVEPLVPGGCIPVLVVDLRRCKDTRRILRDLNACFPDTPGPVAAGVREALGERNLELVARARTAVEAGDTASLGALMSEAQALFDAKIAPACPDELGAPRLHEVLAHPAAAELAFGGKGVGSQGDGCAQFVARGVHERDTLAGCLSAELGVECFPVTLAPIEETEAPPPPPLPSRFS